jgi:hypothetical protein
MALCQSITAWGGSYPYGRDPMYFMVIHHTTSPQSTTTDNEHYVDQCGGYDYLIHGDGTICGGNNKFDTTGCHATGCNCMSLGVGLHGCFSPANTLCTGRGTSISAGQLCALGNMYYGLGWIYSDPVSKMRPHYYCTPENPCSGSPTGTECCGSRYCGSTHGGHVGDNWWNQSGIDACNTIRGKAVNWWQCNSCAPC